MKRKTISNEISARDIGVRGGREIDLHLHPAASGAGLSIFRSDMVRSVNIGVDTVVSSMFCTSIGDGTASVDFVEHLMAALHAAGITDILIEVSGGEVPMFDGSATAAWELLQQAGIREYDEDVQPFVIKEPIEIIAGDKKMLALPAESPSFEYHLSHPHPLIGEQTASFNPATDSFPSALAPARTWGTFEDLSTLQNAGLLEGGTEQNGIVIYPDRVTDNPPWPNAFARHKLLDLYGDLYLLGAPVIGQITAVRTGHADNLALARQIAKQS